MSLDIEDEREAGFVRYEHEDLSPTTKRELRGWYSYAIAAEVFAVVGAGVYPSFMNSKYSASKMVFRPFSSGGARAIES